VATARTGTIITTLDREVSGPAPDSGGSGSKSGGTVRSVAMSVPSALLAISGSPIKQSGTLALTLPVRAANTVFAGPTTGADAAPAFRALVDADIPAAITRDTELVAYAQPLDADLTAIAALTTTSFGRGLLTETNAGTLRTTVGLGTSDSPLFAGLEIVGAAALPALVRYDDADDTLGSGGRILELRNADASSDTLITAQFSAVATDASVRQAAFAAAQVSARGAGTLRASLVIGINAGSTGASEVARFASRTASAGDLIVSDGSLALPSGARPFSLAVAGSYYGYEMYADWNNGAANGGGQMVMASASIQGYLLSNWQPGTAMDPDLYARDGASGLIIFSTYDSAGEGLAAGDMTFLTAPVGTAGDHIPWVQRLNLRQSGLHEFSGLLGIGMSPASSARLSILDNGGSGFRHERTSATARAYNTFLNSDGSWNLYDQTVDEYRIAVKTDGKVGLNGINNPNAMLSMLDNIGAGFSLRRTAATAREYLHYIGSNGSYFVYDLTDSADRLVITTAGNVLVGTTTDATASPGSLRVNNIIRTGTPAGGTQGEWKLGVRVAATLITMNTNEYIQIDIGGTLYLLPTITVTTP